MNYGTSFKRIILHFSHLFLLAFIGLGCLSAQNKYTLSGYIRDAEAGETVLGASVYDQQNPSKGTYSNDYGFYALTLEEGIYNMVFSSLGYTDTVVTINLDRDKRLNMSLIEGIVMKEVVITAEQSNDNIEKPSMGTVDLETGQLKRLPALLGEVDVLKAIQLLPGVMSAGEGNTGFYVRGGGPDQNLVLLDEAVIYNTGHLLGFFSVFNADAIKNTTLIKGGMPARYGGRLSSVVDVQMKEGNDKAYQVNGGIGVLSSRLTVEGPILKEKSSFIVSGRRTYAFDLAQPFLKETALEGTNYFFYDFNAKVNYRFSDKDRIYISSYFGRDVLRYNSKERGFQLNSSYGNSTVSLRWNHLFGDKLFMNVTAIYNSYDFDLDGTQADFSFKLFSGVEDYTGKVDFDFFGSPKHRIRFGGQLIHHKLTPNIASAASGDVEFSSGIKPKYAYEGGLYIQDEIKMDNRLSLNVGLRASFFGQLGPFTSSRDSVAYGRWDAVQTYSGLEPRLTALFRIDQQSSIKGGFSMAYQYLHLVTNSTSTLPLDVWVPSSEMIKPQIGTQYSLGYFRNFGKNKYEASVEVYYKDLQRQIDYRESYVNDISEEVEQNFVFGSGRAYGLELFLKKRMGDFTGWVGYTLSRTDRSFPDIENGRTYPTVYDRTHDGSLVLSYRANPKWDFGLVFVYGTGRAFTPYQSLYFIEQQLNIRFGPRNSARFDPYHRLDLSATYTPKPNKQKSFATSWVFSVYNVYNRLNPLYLYTAFDTDLEAGTASVEAVEVSIFPIIPSITMNFRWLPKKNK